MQSEDGAGKSSGILRIASWASLGLAAGLSAVAAWQAGSHPAGLASASLMPVPAAAEQAAAAEGTAAVAAAALVAPVVPTAIEVRIYTEGELKRGETLA